MNVVQVHNHYRFDGGENIMFQATKRILSEKGNKVFTFERNSKNVKGLWGKMHAFTEGVYSGSEKKAFSRLVTSEHPDVVHMHNVYPLISPSVLVACREADVPIVMGCHNYRLICPTSLHLRNCAVCELCRGGREYWCVLKNCRRNIFESVTYALRSAVARKCELFQDNVACYVPPTEFVKHRLIDAGFPAGRIIVVPNTVSVPDSGVDASRGEYVAYAGRISPEKGIDTLLTSARHTGLPIRLAGAYSAIPEILKTAPQNAKFVGHLNKHQLVEFYRNARFLVIPSICFEAFGLTAAEAMSHGLPVIGSRIGGLPEVIEDGITGLLVEPGNSKDLANTMGLLWGKPKLCREMGQAGRGKAIREYSEDVYYERLVAVYNKAIEISKEGRSG